MKWNKIDKRFWQFAIPIITIEVLGLIAVALIYSK
jgi:hypothetical protein